MQNTLRLMDIAALHQQELLAEAAQDQLALEEGLAARHPVFSRVLNTFRLAAFALCAARLRH